MKKQTNTTKPFIATRSFSRSAFSFVPAGSRIGLTREEAELYRDFVKPAYEPKITKDRPTAAEIESGDAVKTDVVEK